MMGFYNSKESFPTMTFTNKKGKQLEKDGIQDQLSLSFDQTIIRYLYFYLFIIFVEYLQHIS